VWWGSWRIYFTVKLNQIFQRLLIKNQEVDMGLMKWMRIRGCGDGFWSVSCTLGGRLLLLLGRGARVWWGSRRIYFTVS
jgi:hypothetical protein